MLEREVPGAVVDPRGRGELGGQLVGQRHQLHFALGPWMDHSCSWIVPTSIRTGYAEGRRQQPASPIGLSAITFWRFGKRARAVEFKALRWLSGGHRAPRTAATPCAGPA